MYLRIFAVLTCLFCFFSFSAAADDSSNLVLSLKKGEVVIRLRSDLAPKHVAQIKRLTEEGAYNNVVFHRVIPGFMAQTGDVKFGKRAVQTLILNVLVRVVQIILIYRRSFQSSRLSVALLVWHVHKILIQQILNSSFVLVMLLF